MIKLLKYTNCKGGFAENCLGVCENRVDHLSNKRNLYIYLLPILLENKHKPIWNSCSSCNVCPNPNKYFKILNLKIGGGSLITRRLRLICKNHREGDL